MSWRLVWSAVAEQDLKNLPWRLSARVDEAVMLFAAGKTTPASVERRSPTDNARLRLRLRGASALLWVDHENQTIHVARVLANR